MSLLECSSTYWKFAGQCAECGSCTKACSSLTNNDVTLGQIARMMLAAERASESRKDLRNRLAADEKLTQAVRGCFFCTSCKNTCFAHNDVCDLIYHARADFQELGLIEPDSWIGVQVDKEWDTFTAYRAIYGIGYPDQTRHILTTTHEPESDCEVAFFPGCTLAAYGPELTVEIFDIVQELGGKTTLIDHCCGSQLKSNGFYDRAIALCDLIADEITFSGAKLLVCVCPGCANAMRVTFERNGITDVEITSLSAFLKDHGFTPKRALPEGRIFLSKACQDRDGRYLDDTCALLGIDRDSAAIYHGCCGAGGAVSSYDPERQQKRIDTKLSFATDDSTVVSMCPTCTYTYANRLIEEPRPITNKHYAELLFENQFDWKTVKNQVDSMWTGDYAVWLAMTFRYAPEMKQASK